MSEQQSGSSSGPRPVESGAGDRQQFAATELAIVLSHFDVGAIESINEFPRGSRKSPKRLIRTDQGRYLLKRRAPGKDDPYRVAFCHQLQMFLTERHFPLPHLMGTRKSNNSMLTWNDSTYELFEYISGSSYDSSLDATAESGRVLGLFHKLLRDFKSTYDPPHGSYHQARSVTTSLQAIAATLQKKNPSAAGRGDQVERLTGFMQDAYCDAAKRVETAGLSEWPAQIVHGDWHPGNMLFRGPKVVAVIDYDAARIQQRILDVGNGALQFSILGGSEPPQRWPEYLDVSRFKRFVRATEGDPDCVLSRAEIVTIPWLMIEALIAECAIPIAATGSFARIEGLGFLEMIERKVRWLQTHAEELLAMLEA